MNPKKMKLNEYQTTQSSATTDAAMIIKQEANAKSSEQLAHELLQHLQNNSSSPSGCSDTSSVASNSTTSSIINATQVTDTTNQQQQSSNHRKSSPPKKFASSHNQNNTSVSPNSNSNDNNNTTSTPKTSTSGNTTQQQQQQPAPLHAIINNSSNTTTPTTTTTTSASGGGGNSKKYKGEFDEPNAREVDERVKLLARSDNYHKQHKHTGSCACVLGSNFHNKSTDAVLRMIDQWRLLDTDQRTKLKWDLCDLPKDIPLAEIKKYEDLRREASRGRADFGGASKRKPLGIRGTRQFLLILYCLWGHPGRDDVMQREGYCPHCFAKIKKANEQSTLVRVVNHFNMKHKRGANPRLSPYRSDTPPPSAALFESDDREQMRLQQQKQIKQERQSSGNVDESA